MENEERIIKIKEFIIKQNNLIKVLIKENALLIKNNIEFTRTLMLLKDKNLISKEAEITLANLIKRHNEDIFLMNEEINRIQ